MHDTVADQDRLFAAARSLVRVRETRARARDIVRADLDAMAAEARRYLGAAFTASDPLTGFAVALVVRSDERLADDYDAQTPRPPTDTQNRLIVEVLGRALTVEIGDDGTTTVSGDTRDLPLDAVRSVRVDAAGAGASTFFVTGARGGEQTEIPFVRALAALVDSAVQGEARFDATPDSHERANGRVGAVPATS